MSWAVGCSLQMAGRKHRRLSRLLSSSGWHLWALPPMKRNTEKQRRAPHTYGAFVRTYPDLSCITAIDPLMVWGGGGVCALPYPCGNPQSSPGAGSFCPSTLWNLRSDRLRGRTHRLCRQLRTHLKAFYERLAPFAEPFLALFERNLLPHRSTLSHFLATLDQPTVEALRTLCARGCAGPHSVCFPRRSVRPDRKAMDGGGCGLPGRTGAGDRGDQELCDKAWASYRFGA